jgi:hypothetical protein
MVSGRSEINDGVITKFKINNDLTSDFIIDKLGLYANDTNDVNIRRTHYLRHLIQKRLGG